MRRNTPKGDLPAIFEDSIVDDDNDSEMDNMRKIQGSIVDIEDHKCTEARAKEMQHHEDAKNVQAELLVMKLQFEYDKINMMKDLEDVIFQSLHRKENHDGKQVKKEQNKST